MSFNNKFKFKTFFKAFKWLIFDSVCFILLTVYLGEILIEGMDPKQEINRWFVIIAIVLAILIITSRIVTEFRLYGMTKDNEKFKKYVGRIEYYLEEAFDDTFSRVLEKLKEKGDYRIRILNYTATGFPDNYCQNVASLLCNILNRVVPPRDEQNLVPSQVTTTFQTITAPQRSEQLLINWQMLHERLKQHDIYTAEQIREKISCLRDDLNEMIAEIKTCRSNQAIYLARENFWLWDKESDFQLLRMYYLSPIIESIENTAERFAFACASVVNSLYSPRYSLAILPARLDYAHSNQFHYYLINAMSSQHSSAWVLSGLGKKKDGSTPKELPYSLVFTAGSKPADWIIGCKCYQIGDYCEAIWRELRKSRLVLYDASSTLPTPTIYLERFRGFYDAIVEGLVRAGSGNVRIKAFTEFFQAFEDSVNWAIRFHLCRLPIAQQTNQPKPEEIDALCSQGAFSNINLQLLSNGEIPWLNGDLTAFESFFLRAPADGRALP